MTGIYSIQAQESQSTSARQVEAKKAVADDNVLNDPKLTPEERDQMSKAGAENPDKITSPAVDQKLEPAEIPSEDNFGPANNKVGAIDRVAENIRRIEQENQLSNVQTVTSVQKSQDEPEAAVNLTDYRTIKGPATQEEPAQPDKITDYSKIKGPDTQPEGDDPEGDKK